MLHSSLKAGGLVIVALMVALSSQDVLGQTTLLRAKSPWLDRLNKSSNWATFDPSSSYYKWTGEALPSESKVVWSGKDMKRVGDGQCVDFVKKVCESTKSASSWLKGDGVIGSNGKVRTDLAAGTAIATFDSRTRRYTNEHAAIFLRRVDDYTIEVADQNWITGANQARVVGKHNIKVEEGWRNLRKYLLSNACAVGRFCIEQVGGFLEDSAHLLLLAKSLPTGGTHNGSHTRRSGLFESRNHLG